MKHNIWYYTRFLWIKSMNIGSATGCHQMPERSFFFRKYQFPVCARCCGVMCGELLAVILFFRKKSIKPQISIASAGAMFFDWYIQYIGKLQSNNTRRFISGILGGLGCWSLYIDLLKFICKKLKR